MKEKVEGIPLVCQRCGRHWNYKGKQIYCCTCPICKTTVTIRKKKESKR